MHNYHQGSCVLHLLDKARTSRLSSVLAILYQDVLVTAFLDI